MKQEIEQGKTTMEQMRQNIGKAMELTQQSAERAEDAAKQLRGLTANSPEPNPSKLRWQTMD